MSHYAVATMKKAKAGNVPGMLRHDFRETDKHKNKDIDIERSSENIELVADHKVRKQDIMDYIKTHRKSKRKVRSDAVLMDEWIISSDHEYFESLGKERTVEYFKAAVDYFSQKFGRENIMYGNVHLDESTPHMHMGIVPMTEDGILSSKKVFSRTALRQVQTGFPKYMQEHGFEVVRGSEKSKRKKLSVEEYKHTQEAKKQVERKLTDLADKVDPDRPLITAEEEVDMAMGSEWHEHAEPMPEVSALDRLLEWLKKFVKEIQSRMRELDRREDEIELVEREQASKENELAKREKSVEQKEKAFEKFQNDVRMPSPVAQPRFYMQQVNQGIIGPVNELQKNLGAVDKQMGPVRSQGLNKGIER